MHWGAVVSMLIKRRCVNSCDRSVLDREECLLHRNWIVRKVSVVVDKISVSWLSKMWAVASSSLTRRTHVGSKHVTQLWLMPLVVGQQLVSLFKIRHLSCRDMIRAFSRDDCLGWASNLLCSRIIFSDEFWVCSLNFKLVDRWRDLKEFQRQFGILLSSEKLLFRWLGLRINSDFCYRNINLQIP